MAKKRARNMAELKKQINEKLLAELKKDNLVAEIIKHTESDMVEQEVYDRYDPKSDGEPWVYERRRDRGGLADVTNMKHETTETDGKVKMNIRNMTPPHPSFNENNLKAGEVADLVEGGDGANGLRYSNPDGGSYSEPRPFQQETINELSRNKEHVQAMKTLLKDMGIKVK